MASDKRAGRGPVKGTNYAVSYLIDIFAPIGIYLLLHYVFHISDFWALIIGAIVATANTVYGTIRRGKLDGVGVLVIIELVISIAFILITHSPRILLFKPAVLIGIGALYGLYTCVRGKPIGYQTTLPSVSGGDADRAAAYENAWDTNGKFRLRLRLMTASWGIAFLIDAGIRLYFALEKSISSAVVDPQIMEFVLIGIAIVITMTQVPYLKRIVESAVKAKASATSGAA